MVASFPLSQANLIDLIRVRSVTWLPQRYVETSGAGTGETIEAELAPMLWRAQVESVPMLYAEARLIMSKLMLLDGGLQSFYLHNPSAPYPASDPTGSILGSSTVQVKSVNADKKRLALKGLPDDYVITAGDFVAVTYDTSRRALMMFTEGGSANGSGETAELEVRPQVRTGIAANGTAYLAKPAAKMKLIADSLSMEPMSILHAVIRFSALQTLKQG